MILLLDLFVNTLHAKKPTVYLLVIILMFFSVQKGIQETAMVIRPNATVRSEIVVAGGSKCVSQRVLKRLQNRLPSTAASAPKSVPSNAPPTGPSREMPRTAASAAQNVMWCVAGTAKPIWVKRSVTAENPKQITCLLYTSRCV